MPELRTLEQKTRNAGTENPECGRGTPEQKSRNGERWNKKHETLKQSTRNAFFTWIYEVNEKNARKMHVDAVP